MRRKRYQDGYSHDVANHRAGKGCRNPANRLEHLAAFECLRNIAENDRHRQQKYSLLDWQELAQNRHCNERYADADNAFNHSTQQKRSNDAEHLGHVERPQGGAQNTISESNLNRRENVWTMPSLTCGMNSHQLTSHQSDQGLVKLSPSPNF